MSNSGVAQIRHFEPKEWLYSFDYTYCPAENLDSRTKLTGRQHAIVSVDKVVRR